MKYLQIAEVKLKRYQVSDNNLGKQLFSPADVTNFFWNLQDSCVEKIISVCLDVKNRVICFDIGGLVVKNLLRNLY